MIDTSNAVRLPADVRVFVPWWRSAGVLQRYLADLIDAELLRQRPGGSSLARVLAQPGVDLVADCGADSLELMALTAALASTLHLPQAGMLDPLLDDTTLAGWVAVTASALEATHPAAIDFRTSGSSGLPKVCEHPLDALWQEVAVLAALLPGRRRIVSAVPGHHIYGFLFTVLLPQQTATPLPVLDARAQVAAGVWQGLQPGDLVVGHPAFWQAALAGAGASAGALAADITGVSSGAPCDDALANALVDAGLARLVQVYGSSETAGIGWREQAAAPYQLLPYWRRDPGAEANLLRSMPDGTVRACRMPDRLAWRIDGRFLPAGRIDDAVQVGGVNVFPGHVQRVLEAHPAVREAAVRLMRPDEGSRLKAFIVSDGVDSEQSLTGLLRGWMHERLNPAERPASLTFGVALPRQRNGKLADWVIDAD